MSFFIKKIVGIDFHDYSAELVEISYNGTSTTLEAYNRIIIPSNVIVDGEIMKEDELKTILSSLFKNANPHSIETKNLAITFPSSKIITHIFTFPANLNENEIKKAIPYEAETVIPFSMNDIYWDFTVLEKETDTTKKHLSQHVLFACINKQIADKYLELFEDIGTNPILFCITPDSLRYSLSKDFMANKTNLIIDVDTLAINYLIIQNLTIKHFFSTNEGGYKLIKSLSKELQISENEIIDKKEKNKLANLPQIDKIKKFIEKNYKRGQKIIKEYETVNPKTKIDQILLTGKFLNLPKFKEIANTYFPNQKVEIGDPKFGITIQPDKFNTEEKKDKYNPYSIFFNNAIGSAVRALNKHYGNGINLLPDRLRESFSTKRTSIILAAATILMITITLSIGTYFALKLQNFNYENLDILAQKSAIEKMIYGTRYQQIREQIMAFNKEVNDLSRINNGLFSVPTTIKEIYKLLPEGTIITSLTFNDESLAFDVTGIADTRESLLATEDRFKKAEFIQEVISPISNYDEKTTISFKMTLKLNFTKLSKYDPDTTTK